jgi:hypothetical protein
MMYRRKTDCGIGQHIFQKPRNLLQIIGPEGQHLVSSTLNCEPHCYLQLLRACELINIFVRQGTRLQ